MYVFINVHYLCRILQNELEPLMSYQQEISGGYFLLVRPVDLLVVIAMLRSSHWSAAGRVVRRGTTHSPAGTTAGTERLGDGMMYDVMT